MKYIEEMKSVNRMLCVILLGLFYTCLAQRPTPPPIPTTTTPPDAQRDESAIKIDSLHVQSEIRHRYAVTLVTSQVSNMADFAQDVTFDVQLPQEAFISNFSMLIDGVVYPGDVDRKEEAEKRFEEAVQSGQSAGLVQTVSARETNEFVVSVNVAARNHVTFNLTYHELLQRRTGLYEHVIYINPGVIVPDFKVEVFINETRDITELSVPEVRGDRLTSSLITGSNRFANITSSSPSTARVVFAPTPAQQQEYSDRGVAGQFIVNYDVDHRLTPEGEVLVSNGYFVHFFAPEDLPPLGKRIVFVLDTSGSMSGTKNQQLREAMLFILGELRPIDEFGILLFSGIVTRWATGELIPASPENVDRAKEFTRTIGADGGTNINQAVLDGLSMLGEDPAKPSFILFLTDGQATIGEQVSSSILKNIFERRTRRQSIYSLAFGAGADFGLLRKISAQNKGFARKIFEDADAPLQLAGFYNEISTPILSEVFISYLNDSIDFDSLTITDYPWFFRGSEIVVSGRFVNGTTPTTGPTFDIGPLRVVLEGSQETSNLFINRVVRPTPCCFPPIPVDPTPGPIRGRNDFVERIWVYLTIKQLIVDILEETNTTSPTAISAKNKVIDLALKYSFVTPYTSMVVTRPPRQDKKDNRAVVSPVEDESISVSSPGLRSKFGRTNPSVNGPIQPVPLSLNNLQPLPQQPGVFFTTTTPLPTTFPPRPTLLPTTVGHLTTFWGTTFTFPTTTRRRRTTTITTPTTTAAVTTSFPEPLPSNSPEYLASGLNVEVNTTRGQMVLCLDVASTLVGGLVLYNDSSKGIVLTGSLHSVSYAIYRKFSEVQLTLNMTSIVTISTKAITLNGKSYRWWQVPFLRFEGLRVTDNEGLEFMISNKVVFTFHKYGLETRRSLSSPYITVTVKNIAATSAKVEGLVDSLLDVDDFYQANEQSLIYVQDGVQHNTFTSLDKTLEGDVCNRLHRPEDLKTLLGMS